MTRTYDSSGGFDVIAFGLGWKVTRTLRVGGTLNRWTTATSQTFERTPRRGAVARQVRPPRLERQPRDHLDAHRAAEPRRRGQDAVHGRRRARPVPPGLRQPGRRVARRGHLERYSSSDVRLDFPGAWGVGTSWRPRSTLTAGRRLHADLLVEGPHPQLLHPAAGRAGGSPGTHQHLRQPGLAQRRRRLPGRLHPDPPGHRVRPHQGPGQDPPARGLRERPAVHEGLRRAMPPASTR